jgi:hypothetical protein
MASYSSAVTPTEILEAIVDALAEELPKDYFRVFAGRASQTLKSLGNLGLSSRYFYHRSRVHLFREVEVHAFELKYIPSTTTEKRGRLCTEVFTTNPKLFSYVRCLKINLAGDPYTAYPDAFLEALGYFLNHLKELESFALHGSATRTWSEFGMAEKSLYTCLSSNRLTAIQMRDMVIPPRFFSILPSSINRLDIVTRGEALRDSPCLVSFLRSRDFKFECAPLELELPMGQPFSKIVLRQELHFFSRLRFLKIAACHPVEAQDLIKSCREIIPKAPQLEALAIEYSLHGGDCKLGLPAFLCSALIAILAYISLHQDLIHYVQTQPTNHFHGLKIFHLNLHDVGLGGAVSNPSFGHVLQDYVRLLSSAPLEEMHIKLSRKALWKPLGDEPFFDRHRDGFDVADDQLSDRVQFPFLSRVVVETDASVLPPPNLYQGPQAWSQAVQLQYSRVSRETLTKQLIGVLVKVSRVVKDFQVNGQKITPVPVVDYQ